MTKISKLLLAICFVFSMTSSAYAVVVASWGGAYTNSQKLGYGDPTAKKLGIPIDWVDYSGGLSEITAKKEAGAITWDIIDLYASDSIKQTLGIKYLLEPRSNNIFLCLKNC